MYLSQEPFRGVDLPHFEQVVTTDGHSVVTTGINFADAWLMLIMVWGDEHEKLVVFNFEYVEFAGGVSAQKAVLKLKGN